MLEKYKEDKADPQINLKELDKVFNTGEIVDTDTGEIVEVVNIDSSNIDKQIQEVKDMKNELKILEEDMVDVDIIIKDNIDRANRILDTVEDNLSKGDLSARVIEVAAQLINAVTAAATGITGIGYNQQQIDIKNRALDIKENEISVKQAVNGAKEVNITNNNLVMSREELLKMMED